MQPAELAGSHHFQECPPLSSDEIDVLCERLNCAECQTEPCDCQQPSFFQSGVPGIIAHVDNGQLPPDAAVERCDLCQLYPSDTEARAELVRRGIAAN